MFYSKNYLYQIYNLTNPNQTELLTCDEISIDLRLIKQDNNSDFEIIVLLFQDQHCFLGTHPFNPAKSSNLPINKGEYSYKVNFPKHFFNDGTFSVGVVLVNNYIPVYMKFNILSFSIKYTNEELKHYIKSPKIDASIKPDLQWELNYNTI